ncbi:hypothetical protein D3C74_456840 [compost metagenome]
MAGFVPAVYHPGGLRHRRVFRLPDDPIYPRPAAGPGRSGDDRRVQLIYGVDPGAAAAM